MAVTNRRIIKLTSQTHRLFYRLSGGRIGAKISGMPILLLTTTGRKTGKHYTTPLMYLEDGGDVVVVASNSGAARDPGWWRNLRVNSGASVEIGREKRDVTAERIDEAERACLWPELTKRYPGYAEYERMTDRPIPVIRLRPASRGY